MTQRLCPTWILVSLGLLVPMAAGALTYVPVADTTLTDQVPIVVRGRVLDAHPYESPRGIATAYRVEVIEALKGDRSGTLSFDQPGGTLPDGRGSVMPGLPRLAAGEEVLLFLAPAGPTLQIAHLNQGVFRAASEAGQRYWLRTADGAHALAAKGIGKAGPMAADRYHSARHAERFEAWLTDRVAGIDRPADYFDGTARPALPPSKFSLLPFLPYRRWFEFDRGERVRWHRHTEGQAGSPDGGTSAFRAARLAWNGAPNTRVAFIPAPSTSSSTGIGTTDGRNTILFRDFNGVFGFAYDCVLGGVIAGANIWRVAGPNREWKGRPFAVAREAEIIVNDGVACRAADQAFLEVVYTHELGHALGLGHSCGDFFTPPCAGNPILDEAIMRSGLTEPPVGARLSADDIAGLRYLYDPDFTEQEPTPLCFLQPGHPRYCTECGPCWHGQGDCDRDSDCRDGLDCVDNVGAQFGFSPGIDVCVGDDLDVPCPPLGSGRYCTQCGRCDSGEGDCDSDDECAPGLVCESDIGAMFGFAPGVDVCVPGDDCTSEVGRGDFCSLCGPCAAGQGDCDSDEECEPGLTCVDNIGAQFGFAPAVDVCL